MVLCRRETSINERSRIETPLEPVDARRMSAYNGNIGHYKESLKPRGDVARSPKQGYQWPHEKDLCPPKFKKKKK